MMARISAIVMVVVVLLSLCECQNRGRRRGPNPRAGGRRRMKPEAINMAEMVKKFPEYTIVSDNKVYELRQYPAGKWLKITTKPKLDDVYYTEIQRYINGTNSQNKPLTLGVPMVIRFDLTVGHEAKFAEYVALRQKSVELNNLVSSRLRQRRPLGEGRRERQQQWQARRRGGPRRNRRNVRQGSDGIRGTASGRPTEAEHRRMSEDRRRESRALERAATASERVALKKLLQDAYAKLSALVGNNDVTVYSYLNEEYHANPPQSVDPNLTILSAPAFKVFSKGYMDMNGIEDSYSVARNLTSDIGRPLTTYYLADYMYFFTGVEAPFYYEIWISENANAHSLN